MYQYIHDSVCYKLPQKTCELRCGTGWYVLLSQWTLCTLFVAGSVVYFWFNPTHTHPHTLLENRTLCWKEAILKKLKIHYWVSHVCYKLKCQAFLFCYVSSLCKWDTFFKNVHVRQQQRHLETLRKPVKKDDSKRKDGTFVINNKMGGKKDTQTSFGRRLAFIFSCMYEMS